MNLKLRYAIEAAQSADTAFEQAVHAAGYKSRWDFGVIPLEHRDLCIAYLGKIAADQAVHNAFAAARKSA